MQARDRALTGVSNFGVAHLRELLSMLNSRAAADRIDQLDPHAPTIMLRCRRLQFPWSDRDDTTADGDEQRSDERRKMHTFAI